MSRIAFSALSFFFVITVPLQGNEESNDSLIQTACLVRLTLTANQPCNNSQWQSGFPRPMLANHSLLRLRVDRRER
jgi:hypothetical protein